MTPDADQEQYDTHAKSASVAPVAALTRPIPLDWQDRDIAARQEDSAHQDAETMRLYIESGRAE